MKKQGEQGCDSVKKQSVVIMVVAAGVLLLLVGIVAVWLNAATKGKTPRNVTDLSNPNVVFNFIPELLPRVGRDASESMYWVDLSTGETRAVIPWGDVRYTDLDVSGKNLLGLGDSHVVETTLEDGVPHTLGPARCDGEGLVWYTLQWHPNGRDYSALTESGKLVVYRQQAGAFEVLADMSDIWNGDAFSYSWVDDGELLCVPDATGIALLNPDTKVEEHWLTLSIEYDDDGSGIVHKSFEVSNDRRTLVYRHQTETSHLHSRKPTEDVEVYRSFVQAYLAFAQIDAQGEIEKVTPMSENEGGGLAFALSPDGTAVVFTVTRHKRVLFTPQYYAVKLYRDGEVTNLFDASAIFQYDRSLVLW